MRNDHRQSSAIKAALELAALRAEAVWDCLTVLSPDLKGEYKKELARKMLSLVDGKDRTQPRRPAKQISPAQVEEIVWANLQCIHPKCPVLLFSKQISEEMNEYFCEKQDRT
jgi:hypothetical protein